MQSNTTIIRYQQMFVYCVSSGAVQHGATLDAV